MQRRLSRIQAKVTGTMDQFLSQYRPFFSDTEIDLLKALWKERESFLEKEVQWRSFYDKVCSAETRTLKDLHYKEMISQSEDFTFQETLRRSHETRVLHEKWTKYVHLRKKITTHLLFLDQQEWNVSLDGLWIIYRFSHILQEFRTIMNELKHGIS